MCPPSHVRGPLGTHRRAPVGAELRRPPGDLVPAGDPWPPRSSPSPSIASAGNFGPELFDAGPDEAGWGELNAPAPDGGRCVAPWAAKPVNAHDAAAGHRTLPVSMLSLCAR